MAQKFNHELDYINYAHTVRAQFNLPKCFSESLTAREPSNEKINIAPEHRGYQKVSGQDSLVLTKFDLLEAFKGHGDLVSFL